MMDFWLAVLLTSIVSVLTILADWAASKLIYAARTIRSLQRIIGSGLSPIDATQRITSEIERYRSSQSGALAWGADLATVAISMDFAALGIWIHNSGMFPFFVRFNSAFSSREIPIWLIVIGVHAVLLITSLAMKHKHAESVGDVSPASWATFPSRPWFAQNGWMLAANSTGFLSLLSSMVIFTNAI